VVAGPWAGRDLNSPALSRIAPRADPAVLEGHPAATQKAASSGLRLLLSGLGLGACLADDMGLGKTIQVLSLLLGAGPGGCRPGSAGQPAGGPASLLANWASEIDRFAPSLKASIIHPSAMTADALKRLSAGSVRGGGSGHHQLWLIAADSGVGRRPMAPGQSWTKHRHQRILANA